jgi:hypothetical protein
MMTTGMIRLQFADIQIDLKVECARGTNNFSEVYARQLIPQTKN